MCLTEFVENQIWYKDYPVKYAGCRFNARMSIVRLEGSALLLHSPCALDSETSAAIARLGDVLCIVAPGSFHHAYICAAQRAFPAAETYLCPGVEHKCPCVQFDWFLGPRTPPAWRGIVDQVLIRGSRFMWEVAMFHEASKTLILVDAIENFTDRTRGVSWPLKIWLKLIFRMWNRPKLAPEYRLGRADRFALQRSMEKIMAWDFERILLSHGENITHSAHEKARSAWQPFLTPPLGK